MRNVVFPTVSAGVLQSTQESSVGGKTIVGNTISNT